jgi:hypothetical protein
VDVEDAELVSLHGLFEVAGRGLDIFLGLDDIERGSFLPLLVFPPLPLAE